MLDSTSETREFAEDLREAVLSLRSALVALYRAVGADLGRPQEVARRFGVNKNLTWKIAKVMESEDAFAAAPLIPGPEGLGILLSALGIDERNPAVAAQVRRAAAQFDAMVARHTGDRTTLELLLDGAASSRSLEISRKLAYRGNSGLWGLQARARVTAHILTPNLEDRSRIDLALITGYLDLCRLRRVAHWPLFRFTRYTDDASSPSSSPGVQPLEESSEPGSPLWIMPSWCTPAIPALASVARATGAGDVTHYLEAGSVGRLGMVTCFCGFLKRSIESRHGDAHNEFGEVGTHITLPMETLMMDLFVHRELTEAMEPEACVFGRPGGEWPATAAEREAQRLPIAEKPVALGEGPPHVATPLMPDYERRILEIFPRLGHDPRDFAAFRLTIHHPPMPSLVVLRYRLPHKAPSESPASAREPSCDSKPARF